MESKFISYRNKFIADIIFNDITDSMDGCREINGNRILDLGCGDGMLLRNLEEMIPSNCFTYKGIDIELTEEQKGHKSLDGDGDGLENFEEVDIEQFLLREKTEKYNYIVLQEVLEHLDRDKTIPILFRTLFRLSSGGMLIVSVPNYKRLTNSLYGSCSCGGRKFMDDTHKFEFRDGELDNLLRVLDYDIVDKKYIVLYLGERIEKYVGGLVPWKVRDVVLKIKPKWASHFVCVCKKKECKKEVEKKEELMRSSDAQWKIT